MHGVAEDCVGRRDADARERGDLALVGGDIKESIGDDPVSDEYTRGEDAVWRNGESADALLDDPVAGRADGPYLCAGGLQVAHEREHLGENIPLDLSGEELSGGGAHLGFAEAGVDLHHLSADGEFGDLAGEVAAIAEVQPGSCIGR